MNIPGIGPNRKARRAAAAQARRKAFKAFKAEHKGRASGKSHAMLQMLGSSDDGTGDPSLMGIYDRDGWHPFYGPAERRSYETERVMVVSPAQYAEMEKYFDRR